MLVCLLNWIGVNESDYFLISTSLYWFIFQTGYTNKTWFDDRSNRYGTISGQKSLPVWGEPYQRYTRTIAESAHSLLERAQEPADGDEQQLCTVIFVDSADLKRTLFARFTSNNRTVNNYKLIRPIATSLLSTIIGFK